MPYFTDLHTYLHQSSLLIQAYPTARVTTKYSLPRKPNTKAKNPRAAQEAPAATDATASAPPKREPSASLTLKTFHPESGICLKYKTDKAAEVGRLLAGLGRLAKGEVIDMPTAAQEAVAAAATAEAVDKMDVDEPVPASVPKSGDKAATPATVAPPPQGSGGGGKKKKKGKK